jgi:hypothetical protein
VLTACFETIVLAVKHVFAWNGFQAADHRKLLKKGRKDLSCRSNEFQRRTSM